MGFGLLGFGVEGLRGCGVGFGMFWVGVFGVGVLEIHPLHNFTTPLTLTTRFCVGGGGGVALRL